MLRDNPKAVDWTSAFAHQFGGIGEQLFEFVRFEALMPWSKFKIGFDAKDDLSSTVFDMPLVPRFQDARVVVGASLR